MRLLVYSDLQAADGRSWMYSNPGQRLQLWRVKTFYEKLLEIYKDNRCDGLIDLGDTTDDRTSLSIPTIQTVCEGLAPFAKLGGYNIKLVGNHEQFMQDPTQHSGAMYSPFFHTISQVEAELSQDIPIVAASYIEDLDMLNKSLLEAIKVVKQRCGRVILLGHFSVVGSKSQGRPMSSGIPTSTTDRADLGLLGHIHSHQRIGKSCWYVGSPFQQDFGEMGEKKFVIILDTEKLTLERFEMAGLPEYRDATLSQFEQLTDVGQEHRYRVKIKTEAELARFSDVPWAAIGSPVIQFASDRGDSEAADVPDGRPMFDATTLIRDYVHENPPARFGMDISSEDAIFCGQQFVE